MVGFEPRAKLLPILYVKDVLLFHHCRFLCFSHRLQASFQQLFADALHALDGWMTVLLLYVMEFDELYLVMLADFTH